MALTLTCPDGGMLVTGGAGIGGGGILRQPIDHVRRRRSGRPAGAGQPFACPASRMARRVTGRIVAIDDGTTP